MKTITRTDTHTDVTAHQKKQYSRFVEDAAARALKEIDPDKDGLQRLIERGGEFQAHVLAGLRLFTAKLSDYDAVRAILGPDFIEPGEIAKICGPIAYSDEQIEQFAATMPSEGELEWCRDNGYVVIAGPPRAMSLLEIRDLNPAYFCSKQGGWYADQAFAQNDKVEARWLMLRKESVPGSTSRTWDEQQALLSEVEVTPKATEVAWAITVYQAVRKVYLLPKLYVRTSSFVSRGIRVLVGLFDPGGLVVNGWGDQSRGDSIGLSSARKTQ